MTIEDIDDNVRSQNQQRQREIDALADRASRLGLDDAFGSSIGAVVDAADSGTGQRGNSTSEDNGLDLSRVSGADTQNEGRTNIDPVIEERDVGLDDGTGSEDFNIEQPDLGTNTAGGKTNTADRRDVSAEGLADSTAGLSESQADALLSGEVDRVSTAPTFDSRRFDDAPAGDEPLLSDNVDFGRQGVGTRQTTAPSVPIESATASGGIDTNFSADRLLASLGVPVGDPGDDPVGDIVEGAQVSADATLQGREDIAESVNQQLRENRRTSDEVIDKGIQKATGIDRDELQRDVEQSREAAADTVTTTAFEGARTGVQAAEDIADEAPSSGLQVNSDTVKAGALGAATAGALIEPTPFGEALLFSGLAAGGISADVLQRGKEQLREDQTERTFLTPEDIRELEVPDDPSQTGPTGQPVPDDGDASGRTTELDVPDDGVVSPGGQPVPEDGTADPGPELPASGGGGPGESAASNAPGVLRLQQVLGQSRGRREELERQRDNLFGGNRGADQQELQEILRGPEDDVVLGEENPPSSQRDFQPVDREPVRTFPDSEPEGIERQNQAEQLPDEKTGFDSRLDAPGGGSGDPIFGTPDQQTSSGVSEGQRNRLDDSQTPSVADSNRSTASSRGETGETPSDSVFQNTPTDTDVGQDTPQDTGVTARTTPVSKLLLGTPLTESPTNNPQSPGEPNQPAFPNRFQRERRRRRPRPPRPPLPDGKKSDPPRPGEEEEEEDVVFASGIEGVEEILEGENGNDNSEQSDPLL